MLEGIERFPVSQAIGSKEHSISREVSRNPFYVTGIGIDVHEAADNIRLMHGLPGSEPAEAG